MATATVLEKGLHQVESTREFWINRNGRPMKRRWDELTATERERLIEAENRAAYVVEFGIY